MSNHCTLFPDGNWADCCYSHDVAYVRQTVSRKEADRKLLDCVKAKCKVIGVIMYAGVRLFGWYFWNKHTRRK